MYKIEIINLIYITIPALFVVFLYMRVVDDKLTPIFAIIRMFLQLILIGFALSYIFSSSSVTITLIILLIMLLSATIIALRNLESKDKHFLNSFMAILIGGGASLFIVIFMVIHPKIWYEPRVIIPLAGMIFANALNAISLSSERFFATKDFKEAYKVSLIPILNSFFAVGLVSLPGMMTGQILSGVSPLIAVRYQILVMLMVFSSAGISSYVYLKLESKNI